MIQIQLTISRIPVDNSFWSEISEYIYKTNTPLLPIIHMADGWGVMVSCLVLISWDREARVIFMFLPSPTESYSIQGESYSIQGPIPLKYH